MKGNGIAVCDGVFWSVPRGVELALFIRVLCLLILILILLVFLQTVRTEFMSNKKKKKKNRLRQLSEHLVT